MSPQSAGRGVLGSSVRAARPRAGQPYMRKYDDGRLFPRFAAIARALRAAGLPADDACDRELSRLTGRLLAFSDVALGRDADAAARAALTKLPARLFFDYSAEGSLRVVLETCLRFRAARGWDTFELRDPKRRAAHMDMLRAVARAVRAAGLLPVVKVYFAAALGAEGVVQLRTVVQAHGGVVVSRVDVATHVVYPDAAGRTEAESDGQVMVRLLRREGKPGGVRALVHWYYHPDTYDDWIMAREVRGHVEPDPPERGAAPWHVGARWLRDLALFNEWMNERDYEMPLEFDGYEGARPQYVVDQRAAAAAAAARGGGDGGGMQNVRLRLRMSEDKTRAPAAKRMREAGGVVNLVGLPSINLAAEDADAAMGDAEAGRKEGDEESERESAPRRSLRAAGLEPVDVRMEEQRKADQRRPRHADWFEMKRVHEIERRALPEFFSGRYASKTERAYTEARNFMVQTWARTPIRYLSATAARRNLRGDACAVHRIHAFLEHWGLVNYNVLPETRSPPVYVPPPPPLPVHAGRVDPVTGKRRSLLFLDDGSAADIHEDRVRRVNLDGSLPFVGDDGTSDETKSGLPQPGVVQGAVNPLLTPKGGAPPLAPFASYDSPAGAAYPGGVIDQEFGGGGAAPMSELRPVRTTRYSSRRRRVSRYTVDNSSEEDDLDDDDDEDEDEDDGDDEAKGGAGEAEAAEEEDGVGAAHDGDAVEYHCDICSKDCTKVRYHCTQHADMDLCTSCYTERKYPPTMQARDFIQMSATSVGPDAAGAHPDDPLVWSESETLLLLEALEMYGDNWSMVAEHVESKDEIQCMLQFLHMPVEDAFLEDTRANWWAAKGAVSGGADADVSRASPSAFDVLRKCGAKEAALRAVMAAPSTLTGEPLAFSDRISTVVPQVALLATQAPAQVLMAVLREIGVSSQAAAASGAAPDARSVNECVTNALYLEKLAAVPFANDIAATDLGVKAARSALELVRQGKNVAANDATDVVQKMKPPAAGTPGPRGDAPQAGQDPGPGGAGGKDADTDERAAVDSDSSQSVALTAIACAAVRAQKLMEVEEDELRRIHALIYEVKVDMIWMKVEHFRTICEHRRLSQAAARRQREDCVGAEVNITRTRASGAVCEGDEKLVAVPASAPAAGGGELGDNGVARPLRTQAPVDLVTPVPGSCAVRSVMPVATAAFPDLPPPGPVVAAPTGAPPAAGQAVTPRRESGPASPALYPSRGDVEMVDPSPEPATCPKAPGPADGDLASTAVAVTPLVAAGSNAAPPARPLDGAAPRGAASGCGDMPPDVEQRGAAASTAAGRAPSAPRDAGATLATAGVPVVQPGSVAVTAPRTDEAAEGEAGPARAAVDSAGMDVLFSASCLSQRSRLAPIGAPNPTGDSVDDAAGTNVSLPLAADAPGRNTFGRAEAVSGGVHVSGTAGDGPARLSGEAVTSDAPTSADGGV
jgi:hypothetical protein